ncbi:thromboxane A2 receptor isoform X3 [Esox lucius]|uniref:thromboxane A2 receptor isoform X3 n=1 Tax=Esox lucius TaxID=8010 RepID=UPI0014773733|nr:thromboxane A2 receptor isoform X3 [Esox lucius]
MMNLSNETTPICFSINSPPFKFNQSIGSVYYSATFSSLGLTFNLIAFVVLLKTFQRTHSRSRSSFLIFLCGLVVTDFMGLLVTGCIVVTFHITRFNWRELDPDCVFCNFMGMSMVFYGLCPLLLGATMAVERFVGINRPFSHSTRMTKSRAMYVVLLVWVVAGGVSLLPQVGVGSYHMQIPGSWCFFNISSETSDMALCLIFSLVGLLSIATSFLLNTVFIAQTVLSGKGLQIRSLLLFIRFATWNQILDPCVYILFRRAVLKRLFPRWDWSQGSIRTLYPASFVGTMRRLTRTSLADHEGALSKGKYRERSFNVKVPTLSL